MRYCPYKQESSKEISLKPHREENIEKIYLKNPLTLEREIFILHYDIMIELYKARDTNYMILDKSGIYSRIHFLKCANPNEVKDGYDFGSMASIYLTTPKFSEIKGLPNWIKDEIHDTYKNNHIISYNDYLVLDFINVAPDFDNNESYPVWHFIKIRKVLHEKILVSTDKKSFKNFTENNVHYKRGLRLLIILKQMEMALEKPFRTYGKPEKTTPLMISINV